MQSANPRRRSRIPLSCDPCRARKLKCNREQPCQNCTARSEEQTCQFRGPSRTGTAAAGDAEANRSRDATRKRIDHLEDLVKKLIAERQQPPSPRTNGDIGGAVLTPDSLGRDAANHPTQTPATLDPDVAGAGETVVDGTHSVYHGGDEWYTVLREINELKKTYSQQADIHDYNFRPAHSHVADGAGLLYNQVKPIERIEILSTLPPKPEVDRLLAKFFDYQNFPIAVAPIIHPPTFMREYDEHWRDPSKTHIIWLGLLFSVLSTVMLAHHQFGEPAEYEGTSETLFQLYRLRTAQCLQSGDISKCLPYTVETLRLNATAELNRKDDIRRGLWIMTGVIVRAAVNMGYHRDPSHNPRAWSPLQAEYRRRIWLSVVSMDDMASFVGGFPRMMTSSVYSDTREPHNLHDWELSEDTVVLPPSRPLAEPTKMTYLLLKGRLFRALGRVGDLNNSPRPPSYEAVLEVDRAVHDAYKDFPPHMKLDTLGDKQSLHTRVRADFANASLLSMYHRGMCTLHRRFLAKSRVEPRYKFSRDRCVSSALATLSFQRGLETGWYELAQTRHVLILAGMVVILELELRQKHPDESEEPKDEVLVGALEQSCEDWGRATETCDEALRFHRFLVGNLSSLRRGGEANNGAPAQIPTSDLLAFDLGGDVLLEVPGSGFSFEQDLSNMDFDWSTWDAFIEASCTTFADGPI